MQGILEDYSQLALWLQSAIALIGLALAALAVNWLLKKVLLRAAAPASAPASLGPASPAASLGDALLAASAAASAERVGG